ncbi:hypothetical protein A8C32_09995 [Flavivirga aquatica]|uniref:Transmembrane protein n=1 Tax=Flavivirga aquatica TaxID=1849968 RepID=A0A1E5TEM8_9FLAO|nr:hypothetical protein [Flavivirga aquatica]OEK09833.1 hypothetical protein A8C32_09995 [Flavivirga aquatica]
MTENTFYRPVTHHGYKTQKIEDNLKKGFHHVPKAILRSEVISIQKEDIGSRELYYLDDNYISMATGANVLPVWGGGISTFASLLFLHYNVIQNWPKDGFIAISISISILLFCILYYFTMPKKENIMDRMRGTITFTGSFWGKNITMPFNKVIFHFSTGGDNMVGAYMLQIVRPTNLTFCMSNYGSDCYESISGIVWYMDKNRPLPPGTAFDPYRDADFERRKAEGFPPPLYPSQVPTPEATKEQQKERDKYWRDLDYITNIKY